MTHGRGAAVGVMLAGGSLLGAVLVDLTVSTPDVSVAIFFALAPLIAAALLPPLTTAGFALAAVTVTALAGSWEHTWGRTQQYLRITDVAVTGLVAVVVAAVRVRREERQARLVKIADVAQRAVLPTLPTQAGPLLVASRYVSATEDALVGGDFYDMYCSDAGARLLVGDVRGKGLEAVEHAARVIRAFRQSAAGAPDIAGVAKQMNDYLLPFFSDEDFATAVLVDVDPNATLTVCNCGHPPPLLIAASHAGVADCPAAPPLGLATSMTAHRLHWSPGDRLLLYTDGLTEARDSRREFLPLSAVADCLRHPVLDEGLDALLTVVTRHVPDGHLDDDLALVLIENAVQPPPPQRRVSTAAAD